MKLPLSKTPKTKTPKTKTPKTKKQKTKKAKIEIPKIKAPKLGFKKIRSLVLIIILLVLIVFAASTIYKVFFKEKAPDTKTSENVQTEQNTETKPKTETEKTSNAENFKNYLAWDFIKTLESGKYVIKYKTTTVYENQSFEVETTYAVSGSSIALSSNDRATIVKDGKAYMMNQTDKTMLSWDIDPSSDDLERIDTEGLVYAGSSEENGLVCEEYKTASTYLKLYFKDTVLVKMVTVINGLDTVMDIVEVSKEVPENMFTVPQGYQTTEL